MEKKNFEINSTNEQKKFDIAVTKVVTECIFLNHAHIYEKWAYNENDVPKYSTVIVVPKQKIATVKALEIGIKKGIKIGRILYGDKFAEQSTFLNPLRDGDACYVSEIMYKNSYYMTATSFYQPGVVDEAKKKLYPYNVPNGTRARGSVLFKPYVSNGRDGVACLLNNVQILKGRYKPEFLYSRPEDDF